MSESEQDKKVRTVGEVFGLKQRALRFLHDPTVPMPAKQEFNVMAGLLNAAVLCTPLTPEGQVLLEHMDELMASEGKSD